MTGINRQWLLRRRPEGVATQDDFEYRELPLSSAALAPGELLLRNHVFLCAPTMRNWMAPPSNSLYPSLPLGEPVMAPAACEVVASARDGVPVGTRVTSFTGWQDYQRVGAEHPVTPIQDRFDDIEAMGLYGLNTLTGYFGLRKVGRPRPGETLVVSGAAGSTGSIAAQVGKILGCRVIGIAGGAEKCGWLVHDCGLDAAIDYKHESVAARLDALCPQGIDIFYDNVGGEILQAAVDRMAKFGRIVLCGQIATYNDDGPAPGPRNMMRMVYGSITMQGFLMGDYAAETESALTQLAQWVGEGRIVHRTDVRVGFSQIPDTFQALFDGRNLGTLLAVIER
jgi:NADPH-dependent curcumin reductase CurA